MSFASLVVGGFQTAQCTTTERAQWSKEWPGVSSVTIGNYGNKGELSSSISILESRAECLLSIDNTGLSDPFLEINLTSSKLYFQAVNQKSVSDAEKREKLIVIKKLEGLEKELKVCSAILKFKLTNQHFTLQLLAYSESLTDQVGKYNTFCPFGQ